MTDATRYPLSWPFGWKRTLARDRRPTTFTETKTGAPTLPVNAPPGTQPTFSKKAVPVTFVTARQRLWQQLAFLDVMYDAAILSTNLQLNSFGQPRSDRRVPDDPGVAVYFQLHGKDRVLACDKWDSVAGNMAALANHIDAIRRVDRYGVGSLDQAFAGYDALPPPGAHNRPPWRKVLSIAEEGAVNEETVQEAYRRMAKVYHPDLQGGSHEAMAMLNEARDAALQELAA